MLIISWQDTDYVDVIPEGWFSTLGEKKEMTHEVLGPRKGSHLARCDVTVSPGEVEFNYEPYTKFNEDRDMDIGITKIEYSDKNRAEVSRVLWKDRGSKKFQDTGSARFDESLDSGGDVFDSSSWEGRYLLVTHRKRERAPSPACRCS
jgi:hypothetical protein